MSGDVKKKVLESIRAEEVIELAGQLIKIPSENPPGDTGEIASFIKDYLGEVGVESELHEPVKGKISLVARIGGGGDKELVLNGHMDVVPAGDRSRWSFDPFSGEVRDGYILGRGSSDMKGGLAGAIYAFRKLVEFEKELAGTLTLACVADEETGGENGAGYLVSKGIAVGSAVLIAEPTGMEFVDVGQKGTFWVRITVHGKPVHGSLAPFAGENAILKAADLMKELLSVTELRPKLSEEMRRVVEESKPMVDKLVKMKGMGKILDRPTINIGIIKGGTKINMVPERCEIDVDTRVPVGMKSEQLAEYVQKIVSKYGGEITYLERSEPNFTSPDSEIAKLVAENAAQILGFRPKPLIEWASSDARFYRAKNVPTVHYGPGELDLIHGYNERVKAEDVVKAAKVYAGTAVDYLRPGA